MIKNPSRKGHTRVPRGVKVRVILVDGSVIVDRFKFKEGHFCYFYTVPPIKEQYIRSMTIWKQYVIREKG